MQTTFNHILDLCQKFNEDLTHIVFIGGVAVYLHWMERTRPDMEPDVSHDADFMISLAEYGILKDAEEITPTARLAKHQMIVDGVEFDIYVERLHRLVVPYDEAFTHSIEIEHTRVACLEHLLVLKLEALESRGHSSKGEKDRRDVVRIGLLLGRKLDRSLIDTYMRKDLIGLLHDLAKSTIFFDMCEHNAHAAKKARSAFSTFTSNLSR
jgi:hypothetical protein